jgi:hypothetical protein
VERQCRGTHGRMVAMIVTQTGRRIYSCALDDHSAQRLDNLSRRLLRLAVLTV